MILVIIGPSNQDPQAPSQNKELAHLLVRGPVSLILILDYKADVPYTLYVKG